MISKWEVLFYSAAFYLLLFIIGRQIFNFLLRGFSPFIQGRPWVIEQLLDEVRKVGLKNEGEVISIGSGRSGFLGAVKKKYPNTRCVGVEDSWWYSIIYRFQVFLKRNGIKVIKSEPRNVDVSNVDLLYCKLDTEKLRDLDKKFKFECKSGTIIFSNGFVIPNFEPIGVIELANKKGRYSFLSGDKDLLQSSMKKSKKENRIYIYEI